MLPYLTERRASESMIAFALDQIFGPNFAIDGKQRK